MKQKSAEILCIGTELLMGNTVNTNATYIAKGLAQNGINVYHQAVVGDNPQRLKESLDLAFSRSDIVITTGGLGPTYDDLSKETIAAWFGKELVLHEESLRHIEDFFQRLGREMTDNNRKQAMMPQDCTVFPNPNGTAPGCAIEKDGKVAFMLPGPPREMRPMFDNYVIPYLQKDSDTILVSKMIHLFGIGESMLEHKLHDIMVESSNPTLAPYAKEGEVQLRVTARVHRDEDAEAILQPMMNKVSEIAGEFIYGIDIGDLQTAAVTRLKEKGLHVATAESCTGGYVSKRLVDVDGVSEVFDCGVCSYSNDIKEKVLGVSHDTLVAYGAVSEQTAREMAAGVRRLSGAEIGVSTTGIAGPGGGSPEKPVGLVYVAVDSDKYSEVLKLNIPSRSDDAREYIRYIASSNALHLIWKAAGFLD
ncbi:MAG: competence/damage-inducible protein A [Oscillospiraceae bacterium]|nr:competence/damage-inducible protein A [Oscillospiraceae bacterium]